jgi:type II secretory pathway component PulM
LGDPDLPVASKQAVLKAFIEQKVRDIEALERRGAGGSAPQGGADMNSAIDAELKKRGLQ